MEKFRPKLVLVPTDFSDLSSLALQYAHRLAKCFDAGLLVLYAEPFLPPVEFTSRQVADLVGELELSRQAARQHLDKHVTAKLPGVASVETLVIDGRTVPAILNTAREREAGLIVMGTHGRSGLSRVMLGSVTERVLREIEMPVLTVRPNPSSLGEASSISKKILCPVNFTPIAQKALNHAVALAECFGAELQVLHVDETGTARAMERKQKEELRRWIPEQSRTHCQIQEVVKQGEAAVEILKAVRSGGCDLIVLGVQHKRFFDSTVIGTTTVRVIRHAPCPVFAVVEK